MATKRKSHKAVGKKKSCPICGRNHTKSQHLSHGKGSFERFPSRKGKTKETKKLNNSLWGINTRMDHALKNLFKISESIEGICEELRNKSKGICK